MDQPHHPPERLNRLDQYRLRHPNERAEHPKLRRPFPHELRSQKLKTKAPPKQESRLPDNFSKCSR